MKYPNLRYGNPNEFAAYVQLYPLAEIAKRLRRSERTVKDWLSGRKKIPWWVPEIVRLQNMEQHEIRRQMNMKPALRTVAQVVPLRPAHSPASIAPKCVKSAAATDAA